MCEMIVGYSMSSLFEWYMIRPRSALEIANFIARRQRGELICRTPEWCKYQEERKGEIDPMVHRPCSDSCLDIVGSIKKKERKKEQIP